MNYNIKRATFFDAEKIFNLQKDYEHTLISKNSLEEDLKNNLCTYFILLDELSNIIGAIGGTILVDHLDISIVITKKEFTNKGIASSLFKHLIQYCKDNNIESIFLEVRKSNIAAINLYEKFNFVNISTRKNYYKDTCEDALIYMLKI